MRIAQPPPPAPTRPLGHDSAILGFGMYRWVDHTSEVELAVSAVSAEEVFREAMRALRELLGAEGAGTGEPLRREVEVEVEVEAADRAALLAAWLEELLFLAETEALIPVEVPRIELGERRLAATVEGRRGEPSALVKAVTYHRLSLEREDGGWSATVVFDV